MKKIASFDIFDTLLTREVGAADSVFLLLGRQLSRQGLISCSAESFAHARIAAESRAHRNLGAACNLDAIYQELALALHLTESQRKSLYQKECELESRLIRAVPGVEDKLVKVRISDQKVVFISDMYLPTAFIQEQLRRKGLWQEADACYVSCDYSKFKQSGALFREMLLKEGVQAGTVLHRGNSQDGDIWPARLVGMHGELIAAANLNRYEQIMEKHRWETEGLSSTMAGAARLARLCSSAKSMREKALVEVAAGVVAPVLVGYVTWILQRAQQLGFRRLYFLSRDGQVLVEIARKLSKKLNFECDIRYLYGSRQAWNLPAIQTGSDEELSWIWDDPDRLSAKSLLARLCLSPDQVKEELLQAGIGPTDWLRPISSTELHKLEQTLLTPNVRALIVEQANKKRQVLWRYLEQEGLYDHTPWALVDLGWYGSMQNALAALLLEKRDVLPYGFYFALYQGRIANKFGPYRESYYFDEHRQLGYLDSVPSLIAMMEMFCVSNHGTVIDFTEKNGQVLPVLKEEHNQRVVDWGLPIVRQTIMEFIDHLLLDEDLVNPWADIRETVTDLLRAFWLHPTYTEASAWGAFPWEDGLGSETYHTPLASSYTWKHVLHSFYQRKIVLIHRAYWPSGSMVLSPWPIRIILTGLARFFRAYRGLRYSAKRFIKDHGLAGQ